MKDQSFPVTVDDLIAIFGISRPTAYGLARRHGELIERKWVIPAATVLTMINDRKMAVQRMHDTLAQIVGGDHG